MSIKKENRGRRLVEMSLTLPGTPEEVWAAVATGPGISSWFVPTEIEEREGGAIAFDLDEGLTSIGRVTTWAPPHRLAYEEPEWMEGAPPLATEVTVTAESGGTCTLRMVHSLFTSTEDWDDQLESMEGGWPPFFRVLRRYMFEFRGQSSASLRLSGRYDGPIEDAWERLKAELGFHGGEAGAPLRFEPVSTAPLRHVDLGRGYDLGTRDLLLLLSEPGDGIALFCLGEWNGQVIVAIQLFFYGQEASRHVTQLKPVWQRWTQERFPMNQGILG